jgi:hypothetical protein
MMRDVNSPRSRRKFTLHPLIYTLLEITLAQYIVGCQGKGVEAGSIALIARDVKTVANALEIPMLL